MKQLSDFLILIVSSATIEPIKDASGMTVCAIQPFSSNQDKTEDDSPKDDESLQSPSLSDSQTETKNGKSLC